MNLRRDVRHGVRIGRAEFVRSLRRYVRDRRRLVGLGVVVLFFGGNLLFALPTAYILGRTARSVAEIPYFALAATALPVVFLLFAVLRTLERIGSVDAEELVLMTVHPRAVVVGLITAEVARLSMWFGLPLGAFVAAFALGLGSPSLLLTVGLVALPIVAWATVWGYACGIGLMRVLRRLPSVRRVLKVGGVLLLLGGVVGAQFVGRYLVTSGLSVQRLLSALTFAPLADYVALAFAGTPLAQPTSPWALAVLVALVALTSIGLGVASRQATVLWFTEAATRDEPRRAKTSAGGFDVPRPFSWRKAGRIAWGVLLRGVRHPQELGHLMILLFLIAPFGTMVIQASGDALGSLVAGISVGIGTYLAGATFGLNPLGDDRPELPLLLLSGTMPQTFARGRVLAGLAVGAPIAIFGSLASVLLGATPWFGLAFAVVGVGTCLAAALFAVGVGAAYPIYEEREFWGTETVVPSTLVMMAYLVVVGGGTIIGLLVTWYALSGQLALTPVFGVGFGVYLLLTVGLSYGSYRYAVRRYRRYMLD